MVSAYSSVKVLPVLAAGAFAAASYPAIPADLTTPVQQRIAVNGPNSTFASRLQEESTFMLIHLL